MILNINVQKEYTVTLGQYECPYRRIRLNELWRI